MKGIQINNFFNNHISLNGKKNTSKQPNLFSEAGRPEPIVFNHNPNEQEPEEVISYDTLTPQMKAFNKQPCLSTRKKRTNTIEPVSKPRENKKSHGKKSNSYEKFRKTVSMDKYNEKDTSQDHDVSKALNKQFKKPKSSRKNQYQSEGVKRSKSAIIKNTHSKAIESKEPSKQFTKQLKRNIISADSSFKDGSRKQIKKETQNLINKKEHLDKVQCKTARVQSTKVKPRKNKDKIIAEIHKSAEKDDKKSVKFQTQRKPTGPTASKSYLTSAKQSKPVSARESKKTSKKLFDTKDKNSDQAQLYKGLEDYIQVSGDEQNSDVKEALSQLQSVLQGISSKKALAKELKKFTFKLKNIPSKHASEDGSSSQSEEDESNSEAFKRIKDFKNNLVKKKLNEAKIQQENQTHRQQNVSSKKSSSKKLLKPKKKLQEPPKNTRRPVKIQTLNQNQEKMMQSSNLNNETSQPDAFKNTEEEQSKYINSRNVSQFYESTLKRPHFEVPNPIQCEEENEEEVLDASNQKYMEFLKNLEAEAQTQQKNARINLQKENNQEKQVSDNLIDDINIYLNRDYISVDKLYDSEKPNIINQQVSSNTNPILQRRRNDGYPIENIQKDHVLNNYLSDHEDEQSNYHVQDSSTDHAEQEKQIKLSEIEQLKSFAKQSDKMMSKVGIQKPDQQKKKNLTIDLHEDTIVKGAQINPGSSKNPSSPKYDDRYPHMVKSPKFSDIQITNILAVKEKCLESKHQKMNELIQRMYEKQLVSPKSYEYYVYQLKKQYEEESDGFDGFKQQASQILNEINKEKNDIRTIDELIRQEKWDEARKLMKGDHKTPSVFFGFKKNKEKVHDAFSSQQKLPQLTKKDSTQISPSKKHNIGVIQQNINITIKPQIAQQKPQIEAKKIQSERIKEINEKLNKQVNIRGGLIRQGRKICDSSSSDDQQESHENSRHQDSITKRLDFEFEQKFRLKSNEDIDPKNDLISEAKLQSEFNAYLSGDKADSEDFQNYVYYQSEQNESNVVSQQSKEDKNQFIKEVETQRLKPESIFKLFEVPKSPNYHHSDDSKQEIDSEDEQKEDTYSKIPIQNTNTNVIEIDQRQPKQSLLQKEKQKLISVPSIDQSKHDKQKECLEKDEEDNLSESSSLIQLQLRKGFESNLFFIKQYCISLCEYIRDNIQVKDQFKENISQPVQFNTQELLKKYRKCIDGSYSANYNSIHGLLQYKSEFRKPPNKAISLQLAQQFNKTYGPLKFWNRDLSKKGREKFQMEKQAESIFLSAILEVLNESLDFQRPGSIFGKPLAWANSSKHLKNMKYLNGQKTKKVSCDSDESAETYDFIFGVAIARIIQWGSCLCGFLPDTAELENTEIDDDYVVHIRQTRMAFLLQKMLAQEEATFNNSQLEQTQLMLYLGKAIAEQLAKQTAQQISRIGNLGFNNVNNDEGN